MAVHYLEIISDDVDAQTGLYQRMQGLSFGPPDPDLGQARVATQGVAGGHEWTAPDVPVRPGDRGERLIQQTLAV